MSKQTPEPSPPPSIDVRALTRRFGNLVAVDGVSFTVPGGQMTGFVGGNGAGKTTTMRMIMGLLAIHHGEVHWGERPVTTQDRRAIGYMPEERGLYPKQKVLDQLVYLGELSGMSARAARESVMANLERFGLAQRADERVEKLSLGNQQRVQIIAALMTNPSALILDEPFSGLDPLAVDSMVDLLGDHIARGVPVLFSSHQLDLVERLCDNLVILSGGRVVASGAVADLRAGGPERYRLTLAGDAGWVRDWRGIHALDVDGSTALLEVTEEAARNAVLAEALSRGDVIDFARERPALSDIYREVAS